MVINRDTSAIVQGITGNQGRFHTKLMLEYGTRIVAGVTPGKGGESVYDIPVYDTVKEAIRKHSANASILFVPAPFALNAAKEAIENNIKTVVIITEHVPIKDSISLMWFAKRYDATVIGPNTPGVITPGESKLGIMPAHIFKNGTIGIVSRSGTLTYEIAASLTRQQMGQSTCLGLGGDPITGLNFVDVLEMFERDPRTKATVLIGEIGGNLEEVAAEHIKDGNFSKPVVAFIAGRSAPSGKRMGHAGAIIVGKAGTAESKIEALTKAGVSVAAKPGDIPKLLAEQFSP